MAIKATSEIKKYIATHEEAKKIEQQLMERGKNNKPYEDIICPKCGEQIIFTEYGNSYTIKCTTFNCIDYGVRGI